MRPLFLVTGSTRPAADQETPLLEAALADVGVTAETHPWTDDVAWGEAGLVVIRTPWGYFERRAEFLAWASRVAAATTLLNPLALLTWNSHKHYLVDLAAAGVPTIATTVVAEGATAAEVDGALAVRRGEVVIKPAVSAGAVGCLRVDAADPGAAAHLASLVEAGDALVQPFEPSVVDGERSLVWLGGEPSHSVRKIPAAGDYRVQTYHGGRVVPHQASDDEVAVAAAAIATAPYSPAYARVDLVHGTGGPVVMELEVIEPELFLGFDGGAAGRFAAHLASLLPDD